MGVNRNGCDHPGHKGASLLKNANKNVTDLLLLLILVEKVFSLHFMFEGRGRVQVFIERQYFVLGWISTFRERRRYIFTEKNTLLLIKNVSNMWEKDTKNELVYLVKRPGICSYSISCRLYEIKPKLINFRISAHTL